MTPVIPLPEADELNRLFQYDPQTGIVTRKTSVAKRVNVGDRVGNYCQSGYRVCVNYKSLVLTRVIWKMVTGEDPEGWIDHRDGDQFNNSWTNLRSCTPEQNAGNSALRRHNKLGVKGVEQWKSGRYGATIRLNGRKTNLGTYSTAEEAHAVYMLAASQKFGEFACAGRRIPNPTP